MRSQQDLIKSLETGAFGESFTYLYLSKAEEQAERYINAIKEFHVLFGGGDVMLISAPGRTEIGGNHTDHQHGRVLAAGVNLDIICVVSKRSDGIIRIKSEGHRMDELSVSDLEYRQEENNKAISLIRGIAARCLELGFNVFGFDAYTTSNVLKGSGLSSSAAFEVAVGGMINHLFNGGKMSAPLIAQIGQYAENKYFGKPSGLMDQMASSVGGFIAIDFTNTDHPVIDEVAFDFASCGHTLCIVDTKGNHADLTGEYAAIPFELKKVCEFFGKAYLREISEADFHKNLADVRKHAGDRAVLRAIHVYADNSRVQEQTAALRSGNFERFKELVVESGRSSFMYLQNIFACTDPGNQGLSLALALSEKILSGHGAWRVHGGGFAGTIQAFVPNNLLDEYKQTMEDVFGEGSCHELSVRPTGGVKVTENLSKTGGKHG